MHPRCCSIICLQPASHGCWPIKHLQTAQHVGLAHMNEMADHKFLQMARVSAFKRSCPAATIRQTQLGQLQQVACHSHKKTRAPQLGFKLALHQKKSAQIQPSLASKSCCLQIDSQCQLTSCWTPVPDQRRTAGWLGEREHCCTLRWVWGLTRSSWAAQALLAECKSRVHYLQDQDGAVLLQVQCRTISVAPHHQSGT